MNIIQDLVEKVKINFEESLKIYNLTNLVTNRMINSFNNYMNVIKFIDNVSINFSIDLYVKFLENLDNSFFQSDYRKKHCKCICINKRTLITFWGTITYKRRRYYDSFKEQEYYFVDNILMLNKNKNFDPFVCAKICEESSHSSYAKAGRTVSELIGKRLKFNEDANKQLISRATSRNIVMSFDIPDMPYNDLKTINTLYVMLDEKFVHSQFNDNKDFMVKAAVVFEDVAEVYHYKKKENSKTRYKLLGKKVFASIDNDLTSQVLNYIYYSYNTDELKEIVFMGDCASWITSFPKEFKFHKNLKITFSIDGYHYIQALEHICTQKYSSLYLSSFKNVIKNNNKQGFINLCNSIIELEPYREETINSKMNYILNNWTYIQNYYYSVSMKCSMESNISHCFADLFTSRPRAYSKQGLRQLLKLRLLKVNGYDIQKIYFDVIKGKYKEKNIVNYNLFNNENKNYTIDQQWLKNYSLIENLNILF